VIINPYIFELPPSEYGRLYNFYALTGLAPTGLHIPTDTEWDTMTTYLGGLSVAGGKLKEVGLTHWTSPNTGATDDYNFTGLGSGYRNSATGAFLNFNDLVRFWTSTELDESFAYYNQLFYNTIEVLNTNQSKKMGFSVRCIRDLTAQEQIDFADGDIVDTVTDYEGREYNIVRIGTQGWMSTNYACAFLNDGTAIPNVTDNSAWAALTTKGQCAFDNDNDNIPL
jgi:uncharacterized protein (TIGR02145 family)